MWNPIQKSMEEVLEEFGRFALDPRQVMNEHPDGQVARVRRTEVATEFATAINYKLSMMQLESLQEHRQQLQNLGDDMKNLHVDLKTVDTSIKKFNLWSTILSLAMLSLAAVQVAILFIRP